MKERTQHRLVGTLALASLAVIFLPELLQNPRDYTDTNRISTIPPFPTMSQSNATLPAATNNEPLIPPETIEPLTPPAPSNEPSAALEPELSAWVVQVANFTSKKKAERLQSNLRKKGFPAFMQSDKSEGKTIYKVQVGPELNQAQAESVAAEVEKKFKLTGTIEPYISQN